MWPPAVFFRASARAAIGRAPAVTRVERRKLLIAVYDIAGMVDVRSERGGRNRGKDFNRFDTQSEKTISMLCHPRQPVAAMP